MPLVITRDEAYARGLKRFYTGEPCKRGHVCERYVINGSCVDCVMRKTPDKPIDGYVAANRAWPARPFTFNVTFRPTLEEMQAALAYMEQCDWHSVALQRVHDDPALLARCMPRLSTQEVVQMLKMQERYQTQLEIEQQRREGKIP